MNKVQRFISKREEEKQYKKELKKELVLIGLVLFTGSTLVCVSWFPVMKLFANIIEFLAQYFN